MPTAKLLKKFVTGYCSALRLPVTDVWLVLTAIKSNRNPTHVPSLTDQAISNFRLLLKK
jgi:hypothetical protein